MTWNDWILQTQSGGRLHKHGEENVVVEPQSFSKLQGCDFVRSP